jgi:MYXO-CTERM domain-containing protein
MRRAILLLAVCGRAYADGEAVNGFPNWQERVMHEWTNRARCDPQVEMQACGSACGEGACYTPQAPVPQIDALNHSARFHSDEMAAQSYFAHNSICTLVSNINTLYPASCTGAASCACVGGTATCNTTCTTWDQRISLFGAGPSGEIIASGTDPNGAFYQWLYEPYSSTTCGYNQGPPTNGHRWNILMNGPAIGYGAGSGASVGDFGGSGTPGKIASGSHYPRSAATVDAWANWNDSAGPSAAMIDVDGTCSVMALERGTATNGAYHLAVTGVGSGCHRYIFVFHDSASNVVTYPTTGSLGIGPAGSCADWDTSRPALGTGCDCTGSCSGKQCGDDGCGGSCGTCGAGQTCSTNNMCVAGTPDAGGGGGGGGNNSDGGLTGGGHSGGCGCATGGADGLAWIGVLAILLRRRR